MSVLLQKILKYIENFSIFNLKVFVKIIYLFFCFFFKYKKKVKRNYDRIKIWRKVTWL